MAHLGWLMVLLFGNYQFIFHGVQFYSVLVIIDLIFLRESTLLRSKVAWEVWGVIMMSAILTQVSVYLTYLFGYWTVYTAAPELFTEFIVPDLLTLALMLGVFHSRFRLPVRCRKPIPKG